MTILTQLRAVPLWTALAVLLVAATGVWGASQGPDKGLYTGLGSDSAVYSFIDIAGAAGSSSVLAGVDDGYALLTIPFTFQFYGRAFTQVCVSSNGGLAFVGTSACDLGQDFSNKDLLLTGPAGDSPSLLPFWSDLTFALGGGAVYYQAQNTANGRRFIVQWNNAYPQSRSGNLLYPAANPVTFQVVLYERTNQVRFQYKTVTLSDTTVSKGALATVGIRDTGGNTSGRQIPWSYDSPVLGDGKALLFLYALPATQVLTTTSGLAFNKGTGNYAGTVTLKNLGNTTIYGPLQVAFAGLPGGVTLVSPAGVFAGNSYLTIPAASGLGAGTSVTLSIQFKNPSSIKILFTPMVYSGSLN